MSGIENLAILVAATVSTLLGFIAIVFIFWAGIEGKWTRDKLKQNKPFVNKFGILTASAIGILIICFVTVYNSIVAQNGIWQSIFLLILTIGFISFVGYMSLFFVSIIDDITGFKNKTDKK